MSDPNDPKADESRKRKLPTNVNNPQPEPANQDENDVNMTEEPQTVSVSSPAPTGIDAAVIEETPYRATHKDERRELEKLICTVIGESNLQHDLQTQRELTALQIQNDDSDEEPLPRRLRPNNYPTMESKPSVVSNTSNISSEINLVQLTKPETVVERQDFIQALAASSIYNVSVAGPSNMNTGDNNDDGYRTKSIFYSSTDVRTSTNNLSENMAWCANSTAPHTETSAEMNYIPLPSTSTSTDALNSINIPSFHDHRHSERLSRSDTHETELLAPQSLELPSNATINLPVNNVAPSTLNFPRNYVLYPEDYFQEDSDDMPDDVLLFGDEDYSPRQQSGNLNAQLESLFDSESDDEAYLEIITNIQNCYITVDRNDSRYGTVVQYSHSSYTSAQPIENSAITIREPSGPPQPATWRNHAELNGRRGRCRQHHTGPHTAANYRLPWNEEIYLSDIDGFRYSDFLFGSNNIYQPFHVSRQHHEYNDIVMLDNPSNQVSGQGFGRDNMHENLASLSYLRDPRRQTLSPASVSRRPPGASGSRIRSVSTENPPQASQAALNMESDSNDNQEGAQAIASSQASNSQSVPELNVIGICPICARGLNKRCVASTFCGHIFCMECIKRAMIINGKRCPTCRQTLHGKGFHPVYF